MKDGVEAGTEVSGTLAIKSSGMALVVLMLTGTVGDPTILTDEVPQAVKYVPYGTMIQNNNKYSWNKTTYELISGSLPDGMVVKPNGEIYGVPMEAGEFTFTMRMDNSNYDFKSCEKTYTLTVVENTDPNVEGATDLGYELSQRIQNVTSSTGDQTMVSEGEYAEFIDIYLDGNKLEEGVDYTSESGSTRITIRSQTLQASGVTGTHTLGIEFRTQDTDTLKRAAQNYVVETSGGSDPGNQGDPDNQGGSDSGSGGSDGGESSDSGSIDAGSSTETGAATSAPNTTTPNLPAQQAGVGAILNEMLPGTIKDQTGLTPNADGTYTYTVQPGDSLWKIAEKYYGSGAYWEAIYQVNMDVIEDPNQIYAGQVIVLNPTVIPDEQELDPNATYYTVQRGDTLWKIAKEFYGQGWQWRKIYRANSTIEDPKTIYEGQVLLIP